MRLGFAAMAGLGCALMGMGMAAALTAREAMLAAWLRVLERLSACVSYLDDALPDLLDRVVGQDTSTDRRLGALLKAAAGRMRENRSLDFAEALDTRGALEGLSAEDCAVIMTLCRELGKSARPQQIRSMEAARAALRTQVLQASERTKRQKRLYLSLGSMGGLALFLCLL